MTVFRVLDFLAVCRDQDRASFKDFLDKETRYRYTKNLYKITRDCLDKGVNKDKSVISFVKAVETNPVVADSFFAVDKAQQLLDGVQAKLKIDAAKRVRLYKRAVLTYEECVRSAFEEELEHPRRQSNRNFLEALPMQQVVEIVDLHKHLAPDDFDNELFNSIMSHLNNPSTSNLFSERPNTLLAAEASYHSTQVSILTPNS